MSWRIFSLSFLLCSAMAAVFLSFFSEDFSCSLLAGFFISAFWAEVFFCAGAGDFPEGLADFPALEALEGGVLLGDAFFAAAAPEAERLEEDPFLVSFWAILDVGFFAGDFAWDFAGLDGFAGEAGLAAPLAGFDSFFGVLPIALAEDFARLDFETAFNAGLGAFGEAAFFA